MSEETGAEDLDAAKGEDPAAVLAGVRRSLNVLTGLTVMLYAAAMLTMFLYVIPQQSKTNDALCTFRNDLQTRVVQTQEFLRDHPEGFPGVPSGTLQQSLAGQIRTVASLSALDCPPPPEPPSPTPTTGPEAPKN